MAPRNTLTLLLPLAVACTETGGLALPPAPPVPPDRPVDVTDGWDQPAGQGRAYIVNGIRIADRGAGLDLDGDCPTQEPRCLDNALWPIGALGNDQIRQGLLGGESLILLELSGFAGPNSGVDPELTVNLLPARDSDDPFFPANNFRAVPGGTDCCEFLLNPYGVEGDPPLALAKLPARYDGAVIRSRSPVPIPVTLTMEATPIEAQGEQAIIEINFDPATQGITGRLGFAIRPAELAKVDNPFCRTVNPRCPPSVPSSTLLDLISSLIGARPDLDLDGDGQECLFDEDGDQVVDRCCDGAPGGACRGTTCLGAIVPPVDPTQPRSCADNLKMADAYSVTLEFTAVPATIVGVDLSD